MFAKTREGMAASEQEVPVLVVGGSVVGLTTSVLLASHGVRRMLIERHRGTAIHPRAASFHLLAFVARAASGERCAILAENIASRFPAGRSTQAVGVLHL